MPEKLPTIFGLAFVLFMASSPVVAATFTVSKTTDTNDGVCGADCSLREAITASNAAAGSDIINFGVAGTFTISVTPLPTIIQPLAINGTTAPGYVSTPVVRIDGPSRTTGNGLHFGATADGSSVSAVAITRFPENGILIESDDTSITLSYIGVALDGTTLAGHDLSGIHISGADGSIGGSGQGNVISGNLEHGIQVAAGANGLIIQANRIGTTASGNAALPNDGNGIYGTGGSNVAVGSAVAGVGNVISGNGGQGIDLDNTSTAWSIFGNRIGVSASGTIALANAGSGIRIQTSNHSIGSEFADGRNIISANGGSGISLSGPSTGTLVFGNYIGTNAMGTAALGSQSIGLRIFGDNCTIGGETSSKRNVISGHTLTGVSIESTSSGCLFYGNYIGLNAAGTTSITAGLGVSLSGTNNSIGGNSAARRNIVSGNQQGGIVLRGTGNKIQGNYVGTGPTGEIAIPNDSYGIRGITATGGAIGGPNAGEGNLISGNSGRGIILDGDTALLTLAGNTIGLSASGLSLGNVEGVVLSGTNHLLGGSTATARNIISGNSSNGVTISGTGHSIHGNYIGTNAIATNARPNGSYGIRVLSASDVLIGGIGAGQGNLISGNVREGIILESSSFNSFVRGNKIGTNPAGTDAISNGGGVYIDGTGHTVGGNNAAARNLISGNSGGGIFVKGSGHIISGNYVGTTADGTLSILGNSSYGLRADSITNVMIGGETPAYGNVFAGNTRGVNLGYGSHDNTLINNIIGLNAAATGDLSDNGAGIEIDESYNNIIGQPGKGNVIGGMEYSGIEIKGVGSSGNVIQGNFIGTNKSLATSLGNGYAGVYIADSMDNKIGGTGAGEGNVITDNDDFGVQVERGERIEISGNSIYYNYFGIDIDELGFFPNDEGDSDFGANGILNYPLLSSVLVNGGSTDVLGMLVNEANTEYRVEFFSGDTCNHSGFGDGQTFRGSTQVTTDVDGHAALSHALGLAVPDAFLTATVTDPEGNTSEFSPCAQVGLGENAGKFQFDRLVYVDYENVIPATTVFVTRSHGLSGAATVNFTTSDSSALAGADYTDSDQLLSFAPWEVVKVVLVPILYDPVAEPVPDPEKLLLALASPGGGASLGTTPNADMKIWDYTPVDPGIVVSDGQLVEGNSGTTMMVFQVKITATDHPVTVEYLTEPGTAVAGEDYLHVVPSEIAFPISAITQTAQVQVPIKGDTTLENDEFLWLRVWGVANGGNWLAYDIYGRGKIINDDDGEPPPEMLFKDGFESP